MTPSQPNYNAFERICAEAVGCDRCFPRMDVERTFVDLAQPRYVGPAYWTASERRLFLMINPGAGHRSPSDAVMRQDIREYRDSEINLEELFRRMRVHMATWRRFLSFIEKSGAPIDEFALLNIAWCATKGNKYPSPYLNKCWNEHSRRALDALAPTLVVACGDVAEAFAAQAAFVFVKTPHPSARTRQSLYPDSHVIRLLRQSNPKRLKSASALRFGCYRDGMRHSEYRAQVAHRLGPAEAKRCSKDLHWDVSHNFIRIDSP